MKFYHVHDVTIRYAFRHAKALILCMHKCMVYLSLTELVTKITEKQLQLFNQSFKVKVTPLVNYALRSGHTHTHTCTLAE